MSASPALQMLSDAPADSPGNRVGGTVVWFDAAKGFGFISLDEQPQRRVFVEYSGIDLPGYRTLTERQPVTFTVQHDERGARAATVRPR
ncbi:cold-shock protein [Nocardia sp. NPDC020380]|uniref:cold-shock protein n=1 Tax=Nocardia sp. NPDC020380 TaxID=3364309 RepID=UPI00378E6D83